MIPNKKTNVTALRLAAGGLRAALAAAALAGAPLGAQSPEEIENSLLWRQATGGAALDSPSARPGSVAVICEGGFVRAFGESGKPLWEYRAAGRLMPFIARSGTAQTFFGRTNGAFYALNRAGRLLWEKKLGETLAFAPVFGWDGRVFVFLRKRIVCLTASGTQLWEYKLEAALAAQPVPDGRGGFIAALNNNTALLANAFGRTGIVELAAPAAAILPGDYPGILVFYPSGEAELIKDGVSPKKAASAQKDTGAPPPSLPNAGGKPVAAARYKRHAAVALASNEIVLWSIDEAKPVWTQETRLGIEKARLLFDERGVYLFSQSGAAGWLPDGRALWNMKIRGAAAPPVLSDDGVLYAGSSNWLLYAYQVERRSRRGEGALFPFNLPPEGNYGLGTPPASPPLAPDGIDETLSRIGRAVKYGTLGESEPAACAFLLGLVHGGENATDGPPLQARLEALRLLGFIGTQETIPFLARRLAAERDVGIQAALAGAIGAIGTDTGLQALAVFESLIPAAVGAKNARLLTALAAATGRLCRFSGPPLSATGVRLLVRIAEAASSKAAAETAKRELELLLEP